MPANAKTFLTISGAAVAIGLSAGAAEAASMFDLTTGGPNSFNVDGIGLTVEAFAGDGSSAIVTQTGAGLGVITGVVDSGQLDNIIGFFPASAGPESLRFTFDQPIRLLSAVFGEVREGLIQSDNYTLLDGSGASLLSGQDVPGGNFLDTGSGVEDFTALLTLEQLTGSVFTFTVPSGIAVDGYRLSSIEAEAVPTPALLPGLLGLGLSLVRKRKQQALESVA